MAESILKRYRLSPPGNSFAAWSVIAGLAGFCVPLIGGAAAIVLGLLGLFQARSTLNGKGAAVTGICLGVASIVADVLVYIAISGLHSLIARSSSG